MLPHSVVLVELQRASAPPPKLSSSPAFLAINRQTTLALKFHHFTGHRQEIRSLEVLSNCRSHTPTLSKVHIDSGQKLNNVSCMDHSPNQTLNQFCMRHAGEHSGCANMVLVFLLE